RRLELCDTFGLAPVRPPFFAAQAPPRVLQFSADGHRVLAGYVPGVIRVWDAAGALIRTIANPSHPVHLPPSSPDAKFAVRLSGTPAELLDTAPGQVRESSRDPGTSYLAMHPAGQGVALVSLRTKLLHLFEPSGKERFAVNAQPGGKDRVIGLLFVSNGE